MIQGISGDFAELDLPLTQLAQSADMVVTGEFGERIGTRKVADGYEMAQLELRVNDVLAGGESGVAPGDLLIFEGWESMITAVPTGEVLFFLTEKDSDVDPPGIYRWYTSRGIWASTERASIDTPLTDPPSESSLYREEIAKMQNLGELIEYVRQP